MLARGLICRLAADAPKTKTSTPDLPQLAQLLQRSILTRNVLTPPAFNAFARAYKTALAQYCRSYATAAVTTKKPAAKKATATKPTATVKRAVKKTAAQKKAPATTRKVAATKKTPAAKKKPAATKKPTAKKKLLAKKKPAAKTTRKAKKVLTPEEKEKVAIRELKKKALIDPPHRPLGAWHVFVSEAVKAAESGSQQEKLSVQSAAFKALTPSEREHYNHLANEQTATRQAVYKKWIESYTPEEIRIANRARAALRRKHKEAPKQKSAPAYTAKLIDERYVKRPTSSFVRFCLERHASGDFKNITSPEASKLLGKEWKALSASEKQPYLDAFKAANEARA